MATKGNKKEPEPRISLLRPTILRRQMKAVLECLVSEHIQHGPLADEFVKTLSATIGFSGGLSFADYSAALTAAFKVVVTTNDERNHSSTILLPAMAPAAYIRAAEQLGLNPLLVDSDPGSATLSRNSINELMEKKPKAIVVCHGLGHLDSIQSLRDLGVPIIEDVSPVLFNLTSDRQSAMDDDVSGTKSGAHNGQIETDKTRIKNKNRAQDDSQIVDSLGINAHSRTSDRHENIVWPLPPMLGRDSDIVILGLANNSALMAGGGGILLVRNRTNERLVKSISNSYGWAGLSDISAALALAQQHELANGRERCLHFSQKFREALSRSRHRTIDSGPVAQLFFPVLVKDGMKAVQRYATRHRIETQMAVQGTVLADQISFFGENSIADSLSQNIVRAGSEMVGLQVAEQQAPVFIKDYLVGAREIARSCLLFPLYPSLTDSDADRIAKVLATLP